ncbi:hypothetical protein H3H37_13520 [Duganella sp. LX20W]|uniref:Uncharacterized protein n=1 Tax=Rugamonas brunnea TaxID=2758569 RepID=A0A7W2ET59_9BURK|nr:hypothetical protein [Rugamonas brunnea]MBA5638075.1 hypothetical protein [Rugamonas brunnea]
MKPNTITPELTHDREDTARQNRELRKLCAAILPAARQLVRQGVARATEQEADAVQTEEADALLKSLLAELDEYIAALPDAKSGLPDDALTTGVPEIEDEAEREQQWMNQMAGDWAMAAAAFWLDLGHDLRGQTNRQASVMANLEAGRDDELLAAFDLVAARFHVGKEGRLLLKKMHDLTRPSYVIPPMEIDMTTIVYVPELTGTYLQK